MNTGACKSLEHLKADLGALSGSRIVDAHIAEKLVQEVSLLQNKF